MSEHKLKKLETKIMVMFLKQFHTVLDGMEQKINNLVDKTFEEGDLDKSLNKLKEELFAPFECSHDKDFHELIYDLNDEHYESSDEIDDLIYESSDDES